MTATGGHKTVTMEILDMALRSWLYHKGTRSYGFVKGPCRSILSFRFCPRHTTNLEATNDHRTKPKRMRSTKEKQNAP
jgi:hypothetical protein